MKFGGLALYTAGVLAASAAGALLILYLLKLRRRQVEVPFSPLWARVLNDKQTTNWLQRLKRLLSLLLWICIALLLILALADPQPERELERGKNILVLMDTSASMAATEASADNKSRFTLAQQKARELIDEMGPHDKMMIMAVDGQIRSVNGDFDDNPSALREAVNSLKPTATRALVVEGLRTAADTVAGRKDPHIYFISDGAVDAGLRIPPKLIRHEITFEHMIVGEEKGNIAVSGFNIRRYLSNKLDYEVFVQVKNYFDQPVIAELTLYNMVPAAKEGDGFFYKPIEKITLDLGPGHSALKFYEDLPAGSDHLSVKVELKTPGLRDALPLDNEAFVLVPKFQRVRVAIITEGNLFLEAALLLNENFEVDVFAPNDPILHPGGTEDIRVEKLQKDGYNVIIFDNSHWDEGEEIIAPAPAASGNFLYINPKGEDSPFEVSAVKGPLVEKVDRRHPIARWLVLKNLNIIRGSKIRAKSRDKVVVRGVDGPLVVARRDAGKNMVAVGFSLTESDMVFRVALPVFLINTIDWFMDESNSLIQAYRTGENWHIPVPIGIEAVNIISPDGKKDVDLPTHEGNAVYYGANTGFYTLGAGTDQVVPAGVPETWEIAANFSSPRESRIEPATEPLIPSQVGVKPKVGEITDIDPELEQWSWILEEFEHDIWLYCIFAALGLLVLEWFTYHRRFTV